jgi:hypothetical protein
MTMMITSIFKHCIYPRYRSGLTCSERWTGYMRTVLCLYTQFTYRPSMMSRLQYQRDYSGSQTSASTFDKREEYPCEFGPLKLEWIYKRAPSIYIVTVHTTYNTQLTTQNPSSHPCINTLATAPRDPPLGPQLVPLFQGIKFDQVVGY